MPPGFVARSPYLPRGLELLDLAAASDSGLLAGAGLQAELRDLQPLGVGEEKAAAPCRHRSHVWQLVASKSV